jgi:ferredoxin-NADP reductase
MLHRLFTQGRRLFVSKPINHFELVQDAPHSLLMGGGIGITPMIAFAHRLHALGRPFDLHYSVRSRSTAGFISALGQVPWRDNVHLYISDEGTRADLDAIMTNLPASAHLYTCGPEAYMAATLDAGSRNGFDDDNLHAEYFSAPETPDHVNTPFTLRLKDGREFEVAPDATAADTLNDNGISVDVKCSDGICGVCKCALVSGDVEHRDFVLSKAQRETNIILCQSRASQSSGIIEIDL